MVITFKYQAKTYLSAHINSAYFRVKGEQIDYKVDTKLIAEIESHMKNINSDYCYIVESNTKDNNTGKYANINFYNKKYGKIIESKIFDLRKKEMQQEIQPQVTKKVKKNDKSNKRK